MASSESTGKTIALVTLVVLLVAALATAYAFYTKVDDANKAKDLAVNEKRASETKLAEKANQYQDLASVISGAQLATADHAVTLEAAKKLLVNPNTEDPRPVAGSPPRKAAFDTLASAIDNLNGLTKAQAEELKRNDEKLKKSDQGLRASTSIAEAKLAAQKTDYAKVTTELNDEQKKMKEAVAEQTLIATNANKERSDKVGEVTQLRRDLAKQREEREDRERQMRTWIEALRRKDADRAIARFQKADGEVTKVVDGGAFVFLNIGRADGATENLTFGLYGSTEQGYVSSLPKSRVEIVQVIDDHRSKARVYDYDIAHPVVDGDKIFNPVWNPGDKIRVAIVGFVDLDGDGRYDNAEFERIVRAGGAEIVARCDIKDGRQYGAVDVKTAYLVEGEAEPVGRKFEAEDSDLVRKKMAEAATTFRKQAQEFGVLRLDYKNFLSFMGYKAVRQLQPAGAEEDRVRRENLAKTPRFRQLANELGGGPVLDTDRVDAFLDREKGAAPKPKAGAGSPGAAPEGSTEGGKEPAMKKPAAAPKKKGAKDDDDL